MPRSGRSYVALALLIVSGCAAKSEPPGAEADAGALAVAVAATDLSETAKPSQKPGDPVDVGSTSDNLPFVPAGEKAASTAWRTWVYTDVGAKRTRFGYLRAGAVVDIRGPIVKNSGCEDGWVRINPRGFICLGKGATTDLSAKILGQASVRPRRGGENPYLYALALDDAPHFYFQLPSVAQATRVEGRDPRPRFAQWRLLRVESDSRAKATLGTLTPTPDFLQNGGRLLKPYGVMQRLEQRVHAGRAAADSGFAISRVMEHEGRWYAMTTEHDLVAMDRLRIAVPSALHGIEIPEGMGLPIGFVNRLQIPRMAYNAQKQLVADGALAKRQGVLLTGRTMPGGLLETRDGHWVAAEGLQVVEARKEYPSFATGDRKWIDLSILRQTLVAYRGRTPVFATLVSTGRGGMGDPETEFATPRGTFMIYAKHVSSTMDGADDAADSYSLLDVPFVQYFHKGFALHGTYWHDEFGKVRSHGCVNLSSYDAAWLFEWTDPQVAPEWHGVINKERGTVVHIHG